MSKLRGIFIYPVFLICLLVVLIFLPLNGDDELLGDTTIYVQSNKRIDLYERTFASPAETVHIPVNIYGDIAVGDIQFSSAMDAEVAEINKILYSYAVRYTAAGKNKYPGGPSISALHIISSAPTEKNPRPSDLLMWLGDSENLWRNFTNGDPNKIISVTYKDVGTGESSNGKWYGALQLSATYGRECPAIESDLGKAGSIGGVTRLDKSGAVGDRANPIDALNLAIGKLYKNVNSVRNDDAKALVNGFNDYSMQAAIALAHNIGEAVFTTSNSRNSIASYWPTSQLGTLQFCRALGDPEVIAYLSEYVARERPSGHIAWDSEVCKGAIDIVIRKWSGDPEFLEFLIGVRSRLSRQNYDQIIHRPSYAVTSIIARLVTEHRLRGEW
jgi:hypothetical protein